MLLKLSKEIRQYLLKHQITMTAAYLPSSLNVEADWQSRNSRDTSKLKLCPKVFQLVSQLPQYFAWKPGPFSQGTDGLQQQI